MEASDTSIHGKRTALPTKQFEVRESLITVLVDNPHVKVIKNMFAASLLGLVINSIAHDYWEKRQLRLGISVISTGLGKIHIVAIIWIGLNIGAILCYFLFNLWANFRIHVPPKAQNVKYWDAIWFLCVPAYYILQIRMISVLITYYELPFVSSMIVCLEQTRFLMKIHAFIRSNVGRVIQYKPHSDNRLGLTTLSHYVYFLFAPTLIYNDEYPRTAKIRWNFVMKRVTELVAVIFYYAFLIERFVIPNHKGIGLRPYSISELFLLIIDNLAVGIMFLLLIFYVILHVIQNLGAELLRFGDRQFYREWWTATNYSDYFRLWNIVVGDWLYMYIYKDCYELIIPGNKTVAKLSVFAVSAVGHEWVLTNVFGFFFPANFISFIFFGSALSFLQTRKLDIFNICRRR